MAQSVERVLGKDEVPGPNPGSSSKEEIEVSVSFLFYRKVFASRSDAARQRPGTMLEVARPNPTRRKTVSAGSFSHFGEPTGQRMLEKRQNKGCLRMAQT